ncbi:hypothetical protein QQL37_14410 [Pantoea agglomerans]|uniref:hypothetical protein n=1 Tax=Enterobacter agglomerans TaxID=549 RepID=UPI003D80136C
MKLLFTRSAAATVLMMAAVGAQAESLDFEVTDYDTIVVGATAEKVTLRVTGFKYMNSQANAPAKTQLGTFAASTNDSAGRIAVSYGPEHNPQVISGLLTGRIDNDSGQSISTYLNLAKAAVINAGGTDWLVSPAATQSVNGTLVTNGVNNLNPGVYPVTLRAALYLP